MFFEGVSSGSLTGSQWRAVPQCGVRDGEVATRVSFHHHGFNLAVPLEVTLDDF